MSRWEANWMSTVAGNAGKLRVGQRTYDQVNEELLAALQLKMKERERAERMRTVVSAQSAAAAEATAQPVLKQTEPVQAAAEQAGSHCAKTPASINTGLAVALGVLAVMAFKQKDGAPTPVVERFPQHEPEQTLRFVADAGAVRISASANEQPVWHDVARLQLPDAPAGVVWSMVTTNVVAFVEAQDDGRKHHGKHSHNNVPAQISLLFRIVDSSGKQLCLRRIDYTTFMPDNDKHRDEGHEESIRFPLSFQCFYKPADCQCDGSVQLQAALISAAVDLVAVKDLQWAVHICPDR